MEDGVRPLRGDKGFQHCVIGNVQLFEHEALMVAEATNSAPLQFH